MPSAVDASIKIPQFQPARVPVVSPASPAPITVTLGIASSTSVEIPLRSGALRWECWRRTINVSARKLKMPAMCACCLREATGNVAASHVKLHGRGATGSERSWMFPVCGACQAHIRSSKKTNTKAKAAAGLAFVIPIAGCLLLGVWLVGLIIGAFTGLATGIIVKQLQRKQVAALASPTCACLGPAVRFDGFHGTIQSFRFANEHYANAFEQANAAKVVHTEVPELGD